MERARTDEVLVPDETTLGGFRLGERVEADLYRGGRQDDDGITTGSSLVTKLGHISEIAVIGRHTELFVDFDDGDHQVMSHAQENGAEPGYPTAAFRRVP